MACLERSLSHGMGETVSPLERYSWKILLGGIEEEMGHAAQGMGQGARASWSQLRTLRLGGTRQLAAMEGSMAPPAACA